MTNVLTALSTSLDGFIAGDGDTREQPLGVGGDRLFKWFFDGDTPSRHAPGFNMSGVSAKFFDEGVDRVGAAITGRRTYDVSDAWGGSGPMPGIPLFVVTHQVPGEVPAGDPPVRSSPRASSTPSSSEDSGCWQGCVPPGSEHVQQGPAGRSDGRAWIPAWCRSLGDGVRLLDGLEPGAGAGARPGSGRPRASRISRIES